MLRRFILTLLSSWLVNPLGVLIAHWFGFANSPTVILILLGSGACAPFQLFMNECLAAGATGGRFTATRRQLAAVVGIQITACFAAVLVLSPRSFPSHEVLILAGFLAASTLLSYQISLKYYGLVICGLMSMREAVIVGAIPGSVVTAVYLAYCLVRWRWPAVSSGVLLLVCVLPAVAQWTYVNMLVHRTPQAEPQEMQLLGGLHRPNVSNGPLVVSIACLALLTVLGSTLRETIASRSMDHLALILVGLNSLVSLANTATRSAFFTSPETQQVRGLNMGMLAMALLAVTLLNLAPVAGLFSALIASQLGIVATVERGRNIRRADHAASSQ